MTNNCSRSLSRLSDQDLMAEVHRCATDERLATARLIAALAELDARRLYLGEGCSSLFTYCTQVLHLSEHAAYHRIGAARAARRFPWILELLADGAVTLTAVGLVAPHLTETNYRDVLEGARHRTKRDVEQLVASLRPQPAVVSRVRKVSGPGSHDRTTARATERSPHALATAPVDAAETALPLTPEPPRPAVIRPLAPERYKLQCTLSRESYQKLRRAQDLLRHSVPHGDPAEILDRALTLLLASLEKKKVAATDKPGKARATQIKSRHIPANVKRAVWKRDEGRCAFVGTKGRCRETGFLEYHHVVPYAAGGHAVADNIQLRCRAHNQFEAERYFELLPQVRESADAPFGVELGLDRVGLLWLSG